MAQILPSFFKKHDEIKETEQITQIETFAIPTKPLNKQIPLKIIDSITIFGFSNQNLPNIINEIEKYNPSSLECNFNYLTFTCDKKFYKKILDLNRQKINNEIIGVYRNNLINNTVILEDTEDQVGIFRRILRYIF